MKYLIATDGTDLEAKIAKRFGHSAYFMVVDPESEEFEVFAGVGHDEPAHGIGRFQDSGIERVILGNVGPEAFKDLQNAGWPAFLCRNMTVREALEKVKNGELEPLSEPTAKRSIHSARDPHHQHTRDGSGRSLHHGEGGGKHHHHEEE